MNKKWLFTAMILGVLATGCSRDELREITPEDTKGSLTINIKNDAQVISRALGAPTQEIENTVHSFTVYVFNNLTGVLEKSQSFTAATEGEIAGLSIASAKRIVALVNKPGDFPAINNYSEFENQLSMISLDTQLPGDFSSKGLFMSGEYDGPVTLNATEKTKVTIPVKRITAKVKLGSLKITPDAGLSLDNFELHGVSIQRARDKTLPLGGLATTGFNYVGGIATNGDEEVKPYLHESLTIPTGYTAGESLASDIYFYVFPNDNTNNQSTLLTVYGSYNGETVYYPFQINNKAIGTGENAPDGNWIERNKVYTLNINLRKLGNGGENPDVPNEEVALDVTVEVADWEGELKQDVEW